MNEQNFNEQIINIDNTKNEIVLRVDENDNPIGEVARKDMVNQHYINLEKI